MKVFFHLFLMATSLCFLLAGLLLMSSPEGRLADVSVQVLKGTVFTDFRLPGLLVFMLLGIPPMVGWAALVRGAPGRYKTAFWCGVVMVAGSLSFLFTLGTGMAYLFFAALLVSLLIVLLALQLDRKWIV